MPDVFVDSSTRDSGGRGAETLVGEPEPMEFSAWLADWEWAAGIEDFNIVSEEMASVQLFAAYFDENKKLLLTDDFSEMLPKFEEAVEILGAEEVYLTVVNDTVFAAGGSVQKDPELISALMRNEESRANHIAEIVGLVSDYDFAGVEIDYEKIREEDWEFVVAFYRELYEALTVAGKELRIVLEPSVPVESLSLPEGPTYVMMAYNLYGTHSGPGPKADVALITQVAEKLQTLEGNHYLALSAGGFAWSEDGSVRALTEVEAAASAAMSSEPVQRDKASGAVHFTYVDDAGREQIVWYADDETFSKWIKTAREQGINRIALWRLGEIEGSTLDVFNGMD